MCLPSLYHRLGARDPYFGHWLPSHPALLNLDISHFGESSSGGSSPRDLVPRSPLIDPHPLLRPPLLIGVAVGRSLASRLVGRLVSIFMSFSIPPGRIVRLLYPALLRWPSVVEASSVACLWPTWRELEESTSCPTASHWRSLLGMPTVTNPGL